MRIITTASCANIVSGLVISFYVSYPVPLSLYGPSWVLTCHVFLTLEYTFKNLSITIFVCKYRCKHLFCTCVKRS